MKHYIFRTIAVLFIITVVIPPVNLILPLGESIRSGLVVITALLLFPNLFLKGSVIALILYSTEILIYFLLGNKYFDSINIVLSTFSVLGSSIILTEYIIKYDKSFNFSRLSILIIVIAAILMGIISLPQLDNNPFVIRDIYSDGISGETSLSRLLYFIISWGTVTSLPFLFAPMVNICKKTYKSKKFRFLFWLLSVTFLFYLVCRSAVTTSMVVGAVMILLGLVIGYEKFNKKNITRLLVMGGLAVVLTSPVIVVPVISFIQQNIESEDTSKRLGEIKDVFEYGETGGDLGARNELYNQSIDLFWDSPLTGTDTPEKVGKHSFFIDRLAIHGVLFIFPLVLFFIVTIKRIYRSLKYSKVIYILGLASFLFLLFFKSDAYTEIWLYGFFALTAICRYIDDITIQISDSK